MNTKTNAPAAVAQLDKGADKSPKQATVQTVQATKPASNAATATPKGNQAMAKPEFDEKRYAQLHAKSATELGLDDTEHDEYVKLLGQRRANLAAKRKELDTLVDSFVKSSITFADFYKAVVEKADGKRAEITSLFTPKQITAAAAKLDKGTPAADGASTSDKPKTLLMSIKGSGPKPTNFYQGDKLPTPQKAFRELFEKDKTKFAENLKAHYKQGAAEYFETDAGKQELAYFIQKTTRDVGTRKP